LLAIFRKELIRQLPPPEHNKPQAELAKTETAETAEAPKPVRQGNQAPEIWETLEQVDPKPLVQAHLALEPQEQVRLVLLVQVLLVQEDRIRQTAMATMTWLLQKHPSVVVPIATTKTPWFFQIKLNFLTVKRNSHKANIRHTTTIVMVKKPQSFQSENAPIRQALALVSNL
jgi:hypothetical protein